MRFARMIGILVVAALGLAAGCAGNPQTIDASSGAPRQAMPTAALVAMGRPPIPDLPVPIGFRLDEDVSRDYAMAGARFVDHYYKGSADKLSVKRFYERQMLTNRWVLTTSMFARGDVILDFEKDTERCRIDITDGSLFDATHIKIRLWTSGPLKSASAE